MAATSFSIQNIKAISKAECSSIPKIMVIAGPNGVGKSTLLYEISQKRGVTFSGETHALYQPPHRAIRKTTVQRRFLMSDSQMSLSDILSRTEVSGLEGLQISYPARTPDNVDEAGSTIKYTLGKIENRKQLVYANIVEKAKQQGMRTIDISSLPDVYKPLRELTKYLLPHLLFDRVDFTSESNIRCIWKRTDNLRQLELDIDDLSSGEKSIIILFLPLLENEINAYLKAIEHIDSPTQLVSESLPSIPDRLLIVDEPELHLHPDLQTKILTYFRTLSAGSNVQFIISTHSPTLLDQALDDELYIFRAPIEGATSDNQLKKVASNIEKLEALKQLAGNTYLVTTGRSIICIEGDADPATNPADIRLFQLLYPRANAFTFVPTGGKANVIKTVQQLRDHLPTEHFGIKIFGITDQDQTRTSLDGIYVLPVSMIENLLLHEDCLFECVTTLGVSAFATIDQLKESLSKIVQELKDEEIEFRIMRNLKAKTIRLRGKSVNELKSNLAITVEEIKNILPEDNELQAIVESASQQVNDIIQNHKALEQFRGKAILQKFYQNNFINTNISYSKFCYELAEIVAKNGKCDNVLNPLFDQLD